MRLRFLIALSFAFILSLGVVHHTVAFADGSAMADAGLQDAGSASAPLPAPIAAPSEALHNPAVSPVAAWDDIKAARKTSWPLLVFALLIMLGKGLAYSAEKLKDVPVIGKAATWLAQGKRAMLVAGAGTVGAAGYDIIMSGGSLVSALTAAGLALAGILHSTTKAPAAPETAK